MDSNKIRSLIVPIALFCLVPVLAGILLFFLCLPFVFLFRKYWRSFIFWTVFIGSVSLILTAIIQFTDAYSFFQSLSYEKIFVLFQDNIFKLLFVTFNMPEKLAVIVTKVLTTTTFKAWPVSLIIAFGVMPLLTRSLFKDRIGKKNFKKKINIKQKLFDKHRDSKKGALIGIDVKTKKPLYLTEKELGMHTQVLGTTGFGKTKSFLFPLIKWSLEKGDGLIFIDGKGDLDSLTSFLSLIISSNRAKDLKVFSPLYTHLSQNYNPLLRGGPTGIKDRLIGSQIWSEEFYKKKGEDVIQMILKCFDDVNIVPTMHKLSTVLADPENELLNGRSFNNPDIEKKYNIFKRDFKNNLKNYGGIAADLNLFCETDFGQLFECEKGEGIDIFDAYQKNQIIYFHLPVLSLEESAKRIGRMLIHDLKTMVGHIQSYIEPEKRHFFPVYIDEFASFASENFIELINKSRSSGAGLILLHQSMGDVGKIGDNFARQLAENTNVKAILRIDDPATIENYSKMAGTNITLKYTYETEKDLFFRRRTGPASMREVDEFLVDPNEFRNLQIGEGIVLVKNTRNLYRVKFDYINPPNMTFKEIEAILLNMLPKSELSKDKLNKNVMLPQNNVLVEKTAGNVF